MNELLLWSVIWAAFYVVGTAFAVKLLKASALEAGGDAK